MWSLHSSLYFSHNYDIFTKNKNTYNLSSTDQKLEFFKTVIDTGIPYYKYYAILNGTEEKFYVETYEEAESILTQLKEKNSLNKDSISYLLKYETELKNFTETNEAVASLYVETPKVVKNQKINTKKKVDYSNTALGVALKDTVSFDNGSAIVKPNFGKETFW